MAVSTAMGFNCSSFCAACRPAFQRKTKEASLVQRPTTGVWVSPQARKALSSKPHHGLPSPIIYIIVFAVGLPTNALANLDSVHFNSNNWIYGEGLCKVMVAFFYGNMYCSIAFIACISVQRYWAWSTRCPQHQKDNRLAIGISVSIWLFVWLITIPLYLYDQEVRVTNLDIYTCHDVTRPSQKKIAAGYFLTMGTLGFVAPTIVIIISYVLILRALRNSMADPAIAKKRRKACGVDHHGAGDVFSVLHPQ
ncbi:hypothetical protein KUCAC02_008863 [Chaenocephalus aceratus]|uniref:Uncharacterized protein n=1 Tax=Chaenocephalus aceratus TaxID=36190 RepID=A0ACB9WRJ1_CHAAC|nr:hypothetical protein KUCAC02_008863 [Chaenocephalus aceratus]